PDPFRVSYVAEALEFSVGHDDPGERDPPATGVGAQVEIEPGAVAVDLLEPRPGVLDADSLALRPGGRRASGWQVVLDLEEELPRLPARPQDHTAGAARPPDAVHHG